MSKYSAMNDPVKPIAIITPGCITPAAIAEMRAAGYVVVESDNPKAIKTIHPVVMPVGGDMILPALLAALGVSEAARKAFGQHIWKALKTAS